MLHLITTVSKIILIEASEFLRKTMINGIICVAGSLCFSGSVISPKVSVVHSVLVTLSDAPPNAPIS